MAWTPSSSARLPTEMKNPAIALDGCFLKGPRNRVCGDEVAPQEAAEEKLVESPRLHAPNCRLKNGCTISRNGPTRFRVKGPTLHGLPAEPRLGSSTGPFSSRQVFWL